MVDVIGQHRGPDPSISEWPKLPVSGIQGHENIYRHPSTSDLMTAEGLFLKDDVGQSTSGWPVSSTKAGDLKAVLRRLPLIMSR